MPGIPLEFRWSPSAVIISSSLRGRRGAGRLLRQREARGKHSGRDNIQRRGGWVYSQTAKHHQELGAQSQAKHCEGPAPLRRGESQDHNEGSSGDMKSPRQLPGDHWASVSLWHSPLCTGSPATYHTLCGRRCRVTGWHPAGCYCVRLGANWPGMCIGEGFNKMGVHTLVPALLLV